MTLPSPVSAPRPKSASAIRPCCECREPLPPPSGGAVLPTMPIGADLKEKEPRLAITGEDGPSSEGAIIIPRCRLGLLVVELLVLLGGVAAPAKPSSFMKRLVRIAVAAGSVLPRMVELTSYTGMTILAYCMSVRSQRAIMFIMLSSAGISWNCVVSRMSSLTSKRATFTLKHTLATSWLAVV